MTAINVMYEKLELQGEEELDKFNAICELTRSEFDEDIEKCKKYLTDKTFIEFLKNVAAETENEKIRKTIFDLACAYRDLSLLEVLLTKTNYDIPQKISLIKEMFEVGDFENSERTNFLSRLKELNSDIKPEVEELLKNWPAETIIQNRAAKPKQSSHQSYNKENDFLDQPLSDNKINVLTNCKNEIIKNLKDYISSRGKQVGEKFSLGFFRKMPWHSKELTNLKVENANELIENISNAVSSCEIIHLLLNAKEWNHKQQIEFGRKKDDGNFGNCLNRSLISIRAPSIDEIKSFLLKKISSCNIDTSNLKPNMIHCKDLKSIKNAFNRAISANSFKNPEIKDAINNTLDRIDEKMKQEASQVISPRP